MSPPLFFSITATCAATLVGLLFVAVQLTPPGTSPSLLLRRHAMARSTYTLFAVLFALSLFFLFGAQPGEQAVVLIVAAVLGIYRTARTWWPVWAEMVHGRVEARIWQTAWLLIGPVAGFAYLGIIGLRNLGGNPNSAHDLEVGTAGIFIGLFVVALRNSWNLLVEVSPIAQSKRPDQ
jgi:hypothetical protein